MLVALLLLWLLLCCATACTLFGGGESGRANGAAPTVAVVDGHAISLDQVDERLRQDLFEQEFAGEANSPNLHQARKSTAATLVDEYLLEQAAERAGLSPEDWVATRLEAAPGVTEEDVLAFFEEHRERLGPDRDLEAVRPRVVAFLERLRVDRIQEQLHAEAQVSFSLPRRRVEVTASGPSIGPDEAPVTIVEFSDYQCPFCARVEPTIKEIVARYPTQIRVVYRHLPLSFHAQARGAAQAAVCAEEQGRFWAYHDLLFANQESLGQEDLISYARELDLDVDRFTACVGDEATALRVQEDLDEAHSLGATGTPAFFINGILLTGAQPIAAFESLIDEELLRLQTAESVH